MGYGKIHPNWDRNPAHILEGYSLEMTAGERASLDKAAPLIAPETPIAIPFLPNEEISERILAATHIRSHGFEPMPHLSARRIYSHDELTTMMRRLAAEAGVRRALLVAGDPPHPVGPFEDTLQLLQTGIFEDIDVTAIGIGGHPGGHPYVDDATLWRFLDLKIAEIQKRGMAPLIVTQFGFDPDIFLNWLVELRDHGVEAPVRIGIPGPTNIKRLLRYAKFCGVGASSAVLRKYGISLGKLLGSAGPDKLVDALKNGLGPEHGRVRLHFYPFGGLVPTLEWIGAYAKRHHLSPTEEARGSNT